MTSPKPRTIAEQAQEAADLARLALDRGDLVPARDRYQGPLWQTLRAADPRAELATLPMPALVYAPAPCPTCGARTVDEASGLCRATRDETGEATCAGQDEDDAGNLVQPTADSLATLDEWIETHGRH